MDIFLFSRKALDYTMASNIHVHSYINVFPKNSLAFSHYYETLLFS